jgi:hypothetical protein
MDLSRACRQLVARGATTPTWVVVSLSPDAKVFDAWEVVVGLPDGDATLQLLRIR